MIILDGKKLSEKILERLKGEIELLSRKPVLAIVSIGYDTSSKIYVKNKKKACAAAGISAIEYCFPAGAKENEIIECIESINSNPNISAIIVQLPLPEKIDRYKIFEAIAPEKDADCLNPLNFGSFFQKGEANFPIGPATPVGIIKLFEEYSIQLEKKHAVLVGYSDIVGKPLSEMLLSRGATVTICHDKTHDLKNYAAEADILVSATGVRHLITEDMVKVGTVVVDVGISRDGKKISGDVDFENVAPKASYITPVPGGVGPMTVAILLENVIRLANLQNEESIEKNTPMEETRPIPEETADAIEQEFQNYIAKISAQYNSIAALNQEISNLENKIPLARDEKKKMIGGLEQSIDKILDLKIVGWLSSMERYAAKIEHIIEKDRKYTENIFVKIDRYEIATAVSVSKKADQLKNFSIPENYDAYYESSKNYFENEFSANFNEISELEHEKRERVHDLDNAKKALNKIIRRLDEWKFWIKDREMPADIFESTEEFELAVSNHFEHEKERLQDL